MKFYKKLLGVCSFMVLVPLSLSAAQQSQITANNITFYFDKPYEVGQFVSGDWWVLPDSAGGTVQIIKFNPSPYSSGCTKTGHDGWQVNPTVSTRNQSYDDRKLTWTASLMPCLPYGARAGESIVKTKSWDITDAATKTLLSDVAVLTVLAVQPPSDAFRPPYIKGVKPLFRTSDLNLSYLPKLVAVTPMPTLTQVRNLWANPVGTVLDNWTSTDSRRFHARNNIKNLDGSSANYGASISRTTGLTILRSMHQDSDAQKLTILIPVLQWGIDLYHILSQNKAVMNWRAFGGHNAGRKLPILFTGLLFDNQDMLNVGKDYTTYGSCYSYFQEDGQTYYGASGEALWGQAGVCGCGGIFGGDPQYGYWLTSSPKCNDSGGIGQFTKKAYCRDPQGLVDGGHRAHSNGSTGCQALHTLKWQRDNNVWEGSSYQCCCTSSPYIGTHIAALLLNVRAAWNHEAFFDYMDRWLSPPWNKSTSKCGFYGHRYFEAMYNKYRTTVKAVTVGFFATPQGGKPPVSISFTNTSTSDYTSFVWDFGDGATSTEKAPVHSYTSEGLYTVTLTGTGSKGTASSVLKDYILVSLLDKIIIEAEAMTLSNGYTIDTGAKLNSTAIVMDINLPVPSTGTATTTFTGSAGTYTIILSTIPENDGQPTVKLFLNNSKLLEEILPTSGSFGSYTDRQDYTVSGIALKPGDVLKIEGTSDNVSGFAGARIDKILLNPVIKTGINRNIDVTGGKLGLVRLLEVYPNPISKAAEIRLGISGKGPVNLRVYDVQGKEVYRQASQSLSNGIVNLNMENLENGIYVIKVQAKGITLSKEIMILN